MALLFLILMATSILGVASFIYTKIQQKYLRTIPISISIALSIGVMCFVQIVFGTLISFNLTLYYLVLSIGLVLLILFLSKQNVEYFKRIINSVKPRSIQSCIWIALPVLYLLTRFASASLPQQHNDALYYHLAAPKFWVLNHKITTTMFNPSFTQASFWEVLYAFPMLVMGVKGDFNHVVTQLYSQWMHFFFGQVLLIFLSVEIMKAFLHKSSVKALAYIQDKESILFFMAWLATSIACIEWTGGLAKNDYIVNVFIFSAFWFLITSAETIFILLAGLCIGFSYATKMSAVAVFPIFPFLLLLHKVRSIKKALILFAFIATGASATIVKNLISTGNPFFPMFDQQIGPHWIAQWWADHNASFSGLPKLTKEMFTYWLPYKFLERGLAKALTALVVFSFLVNLKSKLVNSKTKIILWIILILQFVFAMSFLRPETDGRYAAFAFSLMVILAFVQILEKTPPSRYLFIMIPFGLLLNIPLDLIVKIPKNYSFENSMKYVNQFHAYQNMKNYINQNLESTDRIVAIADKANFYVDIPYETFTEMKDFHTLAESSHNAQEFLGRMRELKYRYVFLQQDFVYPPTLSKYWDELQVLAQKCKVHEADRTLLLDLQKL